MTCPSHSPLFERQKNLRLEPHMLILLAAHQKIQRPRKLWEKSSETCWTSSGIGDRKYDIFHITAL